MDASQYKHYVLFMLFIKYVSDKYGDYDGFEPPVNIPMGASFQDMIALKGKSDIGDRINKHVIAPLVDANPRLARSDFPDFNDPNKLGEGDAMVKRLGNLIGIFQNHALDFSQNHADHDDILGDGYEYLMRHFATESGKSKGQFYTPAEVSRVIAQVIGIFRMGEQLGPLNRVMADTGCTISLSHHARKGSGREGQPLDLGDEAYSGFSEWARQWELLSRREPYDETNPGSHRLWLRWGGSAGHNGLVALDIEEGSLKDTGGRKWMVTVRDPSDVIQERREAGSEARTARKAETLAKHVRDVREVLRGFPDGDSSSEISIKARLSNRDGKAALLELQSSGEAQPCKFKKNNRTYDGWKAAQPDRLSCPSRTVRVTSQSDRRTTLPVGELSLSE